MQKMIKSLMGNFYERFLTSSIYRLYPERGWIPKASSLGGRLRRKLDRYRLDASLLDVQRPTPGQLVRINYAYARHESFFMLEIEAKAWAKQFFHDCYFLNRDDADNFFHLIFFPRHYANTLLRTLRGCREQLALMSSGDTHPLQSIQLCLCSAYFGQLKNRFDTVNP